jgi:hypothetical protein
MVVVFFFFFFFFLPFNQKESSEAMNNTVIPVKERVIERERKECNAKGCREGMGVHNLSD